jgi:uncharacterized protein (UPF0548 family)
MIREFLAAQGGRPFSYAEVGATRDGAPPGYDADHHRARLGAGSEAFERGKAALARWEMFRLGWVELCWSDAPIAPGRAVAVLAKGWGLWWLNACRIVYVIDEPGRFGFAYGTLPDHVEMGEERFLVERDPADDSVWYDLFAFSRPHHFLTRLAYRATRGAQKRFARASLRAMQRAVGDPPDPV